MTDDFFVHDSAYLDEGATVGKGTRIWHFSHVMPGAVIGEARARFIAELKPLVERAFHRIAGEELPLSVDYAPRVEPSEQEDPGLHHGGRVQEGADRRRPGHRRGEPEVEGELRRLGERAREDQGEDPRVELMTPNGVTASSEYGQRRRLGRVNV